MATRAEWFRYNTERAGPKKPKQVKKPKPGPKPHNLSTTDRKALYAFEDFAPGHAPVAEVDSQGLQPAEDRRQVPAHPGQDRGRAAQARAAPEPAPRRSEPPLPGRRALPGRLHGTWRRSRLRGNVGVNPGRRSMASSFARWMARWAVGRGACSSPAPGPGARRPARVAPPDRPPVEASASTSRPMLSTAGPATPPAPPARAASPGLCECPAAQPDTCGDPVREQADQHRQLRHLRPRLRTGDLPGRGLRVQHPAYDRHVLPADAPATGTCVDTATQRLELRRLRERLHRRRGVQQPRPACATRRSRSAAPAPAAVCTNTSTDPRNCGTCGDRLRRGPDLRVGDLPADLRRRIDAVQRRLRGSRRPTRPTAARAPPPACSGRVARPGGAQASCTTLTCGGTLLSGTDHREQLLRDLLPLSAQELRRRARGAELLRLHAVLHLQRRHGPDGGPRLGAKRDRRQHASLLPRRRRLAVPPGAETVARRRGRLQQRLVLLGAIRRHGRSSPRGTPAPARRSNWTTGTDPPGGQLPPNSAACPAKTRSWNCQKRPCAWAHSAAMAVVRAYAWKESGKFLKTTRTSVPYSGSTRAQRGLDRAAVRALEVGELHDRDPGVGRTAHRGRAQRDLGHGGLVVLGGRDAARLGSGPRSVEGGAEGRCRLAADDQGAVHGEGRSRVDPRGAREREVGLHPGGRGRVGAAGLPGDHVEPRLARDGGEPRFEGAAGVGRAAGGQQGRQRGADRMTLLTAFSGSLALFAGEGRGRARRLEPEPLQVFWRVHVLEGAAARVDLAPFGGRHHRVRRRRRRWPGSKGRPRASIRSTVGSASRDQKA